IYESLPSTITLPIYFSGNETRVPGDRCFEHHVGETTPFCKKQSKYRQTRFRKPDFRGRGLPLGIASHSPSGDNGSHGEDVHERTRERQAPAPFHGRPPAAELTAAPGRRRIGGYSRDADARGRRRPRGVGRQGAGAEPVRPTADGDRPPGRGGALGEE